MSDIPLDKSAGEEVKSTELNKLRDIGFISGKNAGETISGATLPVAVYWDNTDDEWKACDGNDLTKLEFKGFAITDSTDGNSIVVQTSGIVVGFSGLTVGAYYYIQDDKTIGTSLGTYPVMVGVAISATEIFIIKDSAIGIVYPSDNLRVSADTEQSIGSSTYTKVKEITILKTGKYRVKFDLKTSFDVTPHAYGRIYKDGVAFGTERSTTSTSYVTNTEDLIFNKGEKCQLYLHGYNNGERTASARNFRLYFDNNIPMASVDLN